MHYGVVFSFFTRAGTVQESIKTKHPQLLYESKLYRVLQGGSTFRVKFFLFVFFLGQCMIVMLLQVAFLR